MRLLSLPCLFTAILMTSPLMASEPRECVCDFSSCCAELAALAAPGQHEEHSMPGMQHDASGAEHEAHMHHPVTFIDEIIHHATAGTSAAPASDPHDMLIAERGAWTLMFHGGLFVDSQQQTGARGADKVFGANWMMPMAQRPLGPGTFTARVMVSLEPALVSDRRYPELFQIGETAFGKPIVDAQHPHNFFMELALLYDIKLGESTLLSFYGAPVGDPAIGPEAYAHRASSSEDSLAPLGHHLQDSTHIAYDVMTLGLTYKIARIEASVFNGREPGEHRWGIDTGALDSWAARFTLNPAPNWSGQYSITRLKSPEELFPNEDTLRMTASFTYNRPFTDGNWASTLVWGRNRDIPGGQIFNSHLAESTVRFAKHNYAWTRIENVDRSNELLLGENPLPPGFEERFLARVQAYSLGYDREFDYIPHVASAIGGQYTLYAKPASLDPIYGAHPMGFLVFLHFRAVPSKE